MVNVRVLPLSMPAPTPASRRKPPLRCAAIWLGAWVALTATGAVLHWGTWIAPAEDPPVATFLGAGVFKHLGNLSTVPATPGWILVTRGGGLLGYDLWDTGHAITGAILAHGIAWAFWLALAAWLLRVRALIVSSPAPSRPDPARPAASTASPPANPARRRFLTDSALSAAALGSSATTAYATLAEPWDLRVARYAVSIRDLPPALRGLRVVFIADTHHGPRVPADFVRRAFRNALDLKPDVLALGGDYVHNGLYQVAPAAALISEFTKTAPCPVVGVLGNHDWYASGPAMSRELTAAGVRMLDNRFVYLDAASRTLRDEPSPPDESGRAACLCFAGLGDFYEDNTDPHAALMPVPRNVPRIVLAHNPDSSEHGNTLAPAADGRPHRIDLMLSGHTHGGQVRLPFIGPPIVPSRHGAKYAHGLNQSPLCPVITSAGVGLSLVPIRLGVPPEIVEITLT